jgi:eukaryotic-like serine/threonine-protein kinase
VLAAGVVAAVLITQRDDNGSPPEQVDFTATAPWRLRISEVALTTELGCTVSLTEVRTGTDIQLPEALHRTRTFQIHQPGSFRWQASDPACRITALTGSGTATLPFAMPELSGDSDVFAAPARVSVQVQDFDGSPECRLALHDPADGGALDIATAKPGADTVVLDAGGRRTAYLADNPCSVMVSAAP